MALDEALVATTIRLKIGKGNQRLSLDLKSNEATIQVVLDALKLTLVYNAFLVAASVSKIHMQEFWATVTLHYTSLRFKLNGKNPPVEEEIISCLSDLGHSGEIRLLTDVNVNSMHQPWRSFATIINKCLSRKATSLDTLRLSCAQILWGVYTMKHVDYVSLLLEDLVYQVENKNAKKNNDMYYPRFTNVIIDFYMSKDQSISRRNKMFWHTTRDDRMFNTIRVVSRYQDTQIYGANLHDVLTSQDMLESKAYKEYYAFATGVVPPKAKTTYKKKAKENVTSKTASESISKGPRLKTQAKMKQPAKKTKAKGDGVGKLSKVPDEQEQEDTSTDEGTDTLIGVRDVPKYEFESDMESWGDKSNDDDESTNNEDDKEVKELYDDDDEPLRSSSVSFDFTSKFLNLENPAPINTEISSLMKTLASQDTIPPTPHTLFTPRVSALEIELSELKQTNQFAKAISSIPGIVDKYLASKMKEAVDVAVDTTIKSIIKDQMKAQVSKIMPKVEKYVTESLGAEVLVRSMNQSQTAYAVAALLSELEPKKILMDKMEAKKSIERADTQRTLYIALVVSYNSDKYIISSYGYVVLLKRGHDDKDKDQDPFVGSDRGMKRQRTGKDADSSKDFRSKEKRSTSSSKKSSKSRHTSSGKSVHSEEPSHNVEDISKHQDQEPPTLDSDWSKRRQIDFQPPQTWISQAARTEEPPASFDEFNATTFDFSAFVLKRLQILNLTQELQVEPDFNLLKDYFINKDLEYLKGGDSSRHYSTSITKTKAGPKRQSFYCYARNLTSSKDVYSRRRIIVVTRLKIKRKYDYGYLEEIEKWSQLDRKRAQNGLEYRHASVLEERDLPRDIPLDSIEVLRYDKRSKSEIKGKVLTEMELVLEQTQQGTSHEVSISTKGVKELKRNVRIKGVKKEALHTLKEETGSIHMLSELLSCCLVLKIAVMDLVTQCITLP
uniref:Uncharacterized protein n=1 Tax=Tanacetum cinerariifolium TaxID=118510 RepID=A0A6L2LEH5_TANCI|nr:hypothetical protein [Tanacetum cinerariifolium]